MSAWHAVSLLSGGQPCRQARLLTAVRWLSAPAPRFPVAGCDARQCTCRYRHHPDRPGKPQRQADREGSLYRYAGVERRASARAVVSVGEGRVQIAAVPASGAAVTGSPALSLGAGQQYSLERGALQPRIQAIDPRSAGGWRQGTLPFDGETLAAVVEALNEYGGRQLSVDGAARTQRFTGTVSVDRIDEWLQAVEVIYAVRVHQEGNQVFIGTGAGDASRR